MTTRTLTEPQWQAIRAAYEGEKPNVSALAVQYGVSRALLQRRASAERWIKGGEPAQAKARDPAPGPVSPSNARAADEGMTGFSQAVQTRVLLRHQQEWRRLDEHIRDAFDTLSLTSASETRADQRWNGGEDHRSAQARERLARERIETLNRMSLLITSKQRGEREAYRIDPNMTPGPDPATAELQARATAASSALLAAVRAARAQGMDLKPFIGEDLADEAPKTRS